MIDLLLDHVLDAVWHSYFNLLDPYNEVPMISILDNQSLCHKVVDSVDHEQWIALCTFVYQPCKLCWKPIVGKSSRQILGECRFAEVFEGQLLALLLGQQLLLDCLERMPAQNQLDRPIGPDQHQLSSLTLLCQV